METNRFKFFLVVLILLFLFSFRLWQSSGCRQFKSFYQNPQLVTLKVEEDVGADKKDSDKSFLQSSSLDKSSTLRLRPDGLGTAGLRGVNRNISRFFHNKYQSRFILAVESLTSMLDARLITDVLGPFGAVAFAVSLYTTIKTKKIMGILHFFTIILAILFATFTTYTKQSLYLYSVALASFSFWSSKTLVKLPILFILLLAIASFWYFSFSWQLESFCHNIFFN